MNAIRPSHLRHPASGRRPLRAPIALLALATALAVLPAITAAAAPEREPGVARVSLIEGEASYLRGDGEDWTGVAVNAPLVTGDRFYSGPESRAEIQLAPGVEARLGAQTQLDMVELAPDATQVRVALGRATLRVRRDPEARRVEIDTPAVALVARERGVYRIEVDAEGRTTVLVREGELEAHEGDDTYRLAAGSGAAIAAVSGSAPERFDLGPTDDFDQWESQRAQRIANAGSYQYVSEDVYGGEDLDDYGTWEYRRGYGQVWRPTAVASGWAPYTTGRWVWVPPWGWTWLDYAPWGWAPYHYGRWAYLDSAWYWAPGPVIASPVWAPALVGFYGAGWGGGFSWSVNVGFGPWIGWAPLGWGEPCIPWWGGWGGVAVGVPWWGGWGGPRIVNNVFINKQVNIYNIDTKRIRFANTDVPGGFTAVSRRSFADGRMDRVPIGDVGGRQLAPITGRVPITPEAASLPAADPSRARIASSLVPPSSRGGRTALASTRDGAAAGGGRAALGGSRAGLGDAGRTGLAGGGRPPAGDAGRAAIGRGGSTEDAAGGRRSLAAIGGGKAVAPPERVRAIPSDAGRDRAGRAPVARSGDLGGSAAASRRGLPAGADGVVRPPDSVGTRGGRTPVAPRPGGAEHTPYVARRPAGDAAGGRSPGVAGARSGIGSGAATRAWARGGAADGSARSPRSAMQAPRGNRGAPSAGVPGGRTSIPGGAGRSIAPPARAAMSRGGAVSAPRAWSGSTGGGRAITAPRSSSPYGGGSPGAVYRGGSPYGGGSPYAGGSRLAGGSGGMTAYGGGRVGGFSGGGSSGGAYAGGLSGGGYGGRGYGGFSGGRTFGGAGIGRGGSMSGGGMSGGSRAGIGR